MMFAGDKKGCCECVMFAGDGEGGGGVVNV